MVKVKINLIHVLLIFEDAWDLVVIRNTELKDILIGNWKHEDFEYLEGEQAEELLDELWFKADMFSEAYFWKSEDEIMCEFKNGEKIFIQRP